MTIKEFRAQVACGTLTEIPYTYNTFKRLYMVRCMRKMVRNDSMSHYRLGNELFRCWKDIGVYTLCIFMIIFVYDINELANPEWWVSSDIITIGLKFLAIIGYPIVMWIINVKRWDKNKPTVIPVINRWEREIDEQMERLNGMGVNIGQLAKALQRLKKTKGVIK